MLNMLITYIATVFLDLKLITKNLKATTAASCEGPIGFQGVELTMGQAASSSSEVFSTLQRIG